jgi:DNA-binding MarR family transcriptional regulator
MSKSKSSLRSIDPEAEFGLDVPEYFFYLLFQAVRRRDAAFERALTGLDLTLAQWRAISTIRRFESCAMSELSAFTAVDRTTLTRSVDQLVRRDLVARRTPEADRRQVRLSLTDHGQRLYGRAVEHLLDFNRQALAGVPAERQRDMGRGLAAVIRNLEPDEAMAEALIRFEPARLPGRRS